MGSSSVAVTRETMSGKHIKLPFGTVGNKSKERSIKLNLPPNFRKNVLFGKLPYFPHLQNPALVDVVKIECEEFKSTKISFSNLAFERQYSG